MHERISRASFATHSFQTAKPTHFNPIALLNPSTRLNVATDRYIFSPFCCLFFWNELGVLLLLVLENDDLSVDRPLAVPSSFQVKMVKSTDRSRSRRRPSGTGSQPKRKRLIAPRFLPGPPKIQRSTRSPGLKDFSMDYNRWPTQRETVLLARTTLASNRKNGMACKQRSYLHS